MSMFDLPPKLRSLASSDTQDRGRSRATPFSRSKKTRFQHLSTVKLDNVMDDADTVYYMVLDFFQEYIFDVTVFTLMPRRMVQSLFPFFSNRTYLAGDVIAHKGDICDSLYIIVEGVCVTKNYETPVRTFTKKSYFGDLFLFFGQHKSVWPQTIVAQNTVVLAEIEIEDIIRILDANVHDRNLYDQLKSVHLYGPPAAQHEYVARTTNCAIFTHCSAQMRAAIESIADIQIILPGNPIVEEGSAVNSIYILLRGIACVSVSERNVRELADRDTLQIIARTIQEERDELRCVLSAEEVRETVCFRFGATNLLNITTQAFDTTIGEEYNLTTSSLWTFGVRAKTGCVVSLLDKDVLRRVLEDFPEDMATVQGKLLGDESLYVKLSKNVRKPRVSVVRSNSILEDWNTSFLTGRHADRCSSVTRWTKVCGDVIWKNRPFIGCSTDFIDFIEGCMLCQSFFEGKIICCEETRALFFIAKGTVMAWGDDGEEQELGPMQTFGLLSIGPSHNRPRNARAVTFVVTFALYANAMLNALEKFPMDKKLIFRQLGYGTSIIGHDDAVCSVLTRTTDFFKSSTPPFLRALIGVKVSRIYMKNDCILEQGAIGNTMFIITSGSATAKKLHASGVVETLGKLEEGTVIGETSALGDGGARRMCYVVVDSPFCAVWVVQKSAFVELLNSFADDREYFKNVVRERMQQDVPNIIFNHPFWNGYENRFRSCLVVSCKTVVYFFDDIVVKQGQIDDRMYYITRGECSVKYTNVSVCKLYSGSSFGFTLMTGDTKRHIATLSSDALCHCVTLSTDALKLALDMCPEMKINIQKLRQVELVALLRLSNTYRRGCRQKRLTALSVGGVIERASKSSCITNTLEDLARKSFNFWRAYVGGCRNRRNQLNVMRATALSWTQSWVKTRKKREGVQNGRPLTDALEFTKEGLGTKFDGRLPVFDTTIYSSTYSRAKSVQRRLTEWSKPKSSPYYKLQLWDVLPLLPQSVQERANSPVKRQRRRDSAQYVASNVSSKVS